MSQDCLFLIESSSAEAPHADILFQDLPVSWRARTTAPATARPAAHVRAPLSFKQRTGREAQIPVVINYTWENEWPPSCGRCQSCFAHASGTLGVWACTEAKNLPVGHMVLGFCYLANWETCLERLCCALSTLMSLELQKVVSLQRQNLQQMGHVPVVFWFASPAGFGYFFLLPSPPFFPRQRNIKGNSMLALQNVLLLVLAFWGPRDPSVLHATTAGVVEGSPCQNICLLLFCLPFHQGGCASEMDCRWHYRVISSSKHNAHSLFPSNSWMWLWRSQTDDCPWREFLSGFLLINFKACLGRSLRV